LRAQELSDGGSGLGRQQHQVVNLVLLGSATVVRVGGHDLIIKLNAVIGHLRPCLHAKDFMHHGGRLSGGSSEQDFIKLEEMVTSAGADGRGTSRAVFASVVRELEGR
jgi:hypothetical protein